MDCLASINSSASKLPLVQLMGGDGVPPCVLLLPGPLLPTHHEGFHGEDGGTGDDDDEGGGRTDILHLCPEHLPGDDLVLGDDIKDFCFLDTDPGGGPKCSGYPVAPGIASLLFFIGDPSKPSSELCRDFFPNLNGS